jgi:integrase
MPDGRDTERRGWRERIESGLYRAHRVSCPRSRDRRPRGRCTCPYSLKVPGHRPSETRTITHSGPIADARTERRRLLALGRPATPPEKPAVSQTLREFAASYLSTRELVLAPNTIANIETDFRLRIDPALGHLALDDITRECLEVFLADLVRASSSRRMVVGTVASLRSILGAAVEWRHVRANPALRLRVPAAEHHRQQAVERVLDHDQLQRLLDACGTTRIETMLRVAAEAGLRRGEVIGLCWPNVDLTTRRLEVRRNITRLIGQGKVARTTKGRRARRVAISESLARRLADWYAESVVEAGAPATGPVWPGRNGEYLGAGSPGQALSRTLRRAGLLDSNRQELVTFHGLRHTAGSMMLAAGVPLIVVSRQLGHATPHVTAQVYAHLLGDEQLDQAARVFDRGERRGANVTARPNP